MPKSSPSPTKAEKSRWDRFRNIGCITCLLSSGVKGEPYDIHHLLVGGRRAGHWFTIPLCPSHHRDPNQPSIAAGSKVFSSIHGTEWDAWLKTQHLLNLDDTLPPSKLVARRLSGSGRNGSGG